MTFYLGIDFGTSGARAIVIDAKGTIQTEARCDLGDRQSAVAWQEALFQLLLMLPAPLRQGMAAIALNGTSGTVLLCDAKGHPITEPLLYNDDRAAGVLEQLRPIAPPNHTVISATSSLAKLLWWQQQPELERAVYFLHQADWLASLLHGQLGLSDYHNSLKLGYDVEQFCYPGWLQSLGLMPLLPRVVAPGTVIGPVQARLVEWFGLPPTCVVRAGTTDSIAAFLASGVREPGEAVSSLGSTLVLKLLSRVRVEDSQFGIYSHRLGDRWLVGGASNTGGAVLRQFFSNAELATLSSQIPAQQASPLDYYPLLKPGERFPVNDPGLLPRLTPQPENRVAFLHGLLESMARIEAQGYQLLQDRGATPVQTVYTAGGGAKNLAWATIRERHLRVPIQMAAQTEAAYGSALLAAGQVANCTERLV